MNKQARIDFMNYLSNLLEACHYLKKEVNKNKKKEVTPVKALFLEIRLFASAINLLSRGKLNAPFKACEEARKAIYLAGNW